jgi:outer membrane protein OmpA-like peptidoglycan-associated protein
MCAECEEEQRATVRRKGESGSFVEPAADAPALAGLEAGGQPMPATLRGEFEPRFGRDFGDVRLHTDSRAAQSARSFDALAYTYGRHVVFGAGQFDPSTLRGRRLIAHELAHVTQQSGHSQPAVQRQKGDWKFDPCVTVPGLGKLCGQAAADACKKASWIPGCSLVCKAFDCSKPAEPKTKCPPGWRASTARGFEGQCCPGDISSERDCCTPDRIVNSPVGSRCCPPDTVVYGNECKSSKDIPAKPPCPESQQTWGGRCCEPPLVPEGFACVQPHKPAPVPVPTPPKSVVPEPFDILFKLDRPREGEDAAALSSATTSEGKANFDALVRRLKGDATLKVQLVGRASPEGTEAYNLDLGARRARMVAEALKAAGISDAQIADPPEADLREECQSLGAGLATCGEAGATGARDRETMARVFQGGTP